MLAVQAFDGSAAGSLATELPLALPFLDFGALCSIISHADTGSRYDCYTNADRNA